MGWDNQAYVFYCFDKDKTVFAAEFNRMNFYYILFFTRNKNLWIGITRNIINQEPSSKKIILPITLSSCAGKNYKVYYQVFLEIMKKNYLEWLSDGWVLRVDSDVSYFIF